MCPAMCRLGASVKRNRVERENFGSSVVVSFALPRYVDFVVKKLRKKVLAGIADSPDSKSKSRGRENT